MQNKGEKASACSHIQSLLDMQISYEGCQASLPNLSLLIPAAGNALSIALAAQIPVFCYYLFRMQI
jgi:hypothetical protein